MTGAADDYTTDSGRNTSTLQQLKNLYGREAPELAFRAQMAGELAQWRQALRARLRALLGLDQLAAEQVSPLAEVMCRVEEAAYTAEKVLLQTQGDMWVPAWVLVPRSLGPHPAILCLHGHGMSKDVTAGRPTSDDERQAINSYGADYGRQYAERGYLCFCPDARGFGERRDPPPLGDCTHLYRNALVVGRSLTGLRVWDHLRGLEYLLTRPDVDTGRIGVVGLSMGCEHAMYLAALDERVRAAVLSCCLRALREEIREEGGHCLCSFVAGLFAVADWPDIACLIAPRPVLIQQGIHDDWVRMNLVYSAVAKVQQAYQLAGAPARIETDYFAGKHQFSAARALPWMDRWLKGT